MNFTRRRTDRARRSYNRWRRICRKLQPHWRPDFPKRWDAALESSRSFWIGRVGKPLRDGV